MSSGTRRAMPTLPIGKAGALRNDDFVRKIAPAAKKVGAALTIEQHATRWLAPRYLDVSKTIEFSSGAPRGPGAAAMKCQSYLQIPCFENTPIARPGFVHGLIHHAR